MVKFYYHVIRKDIHNIWLGPGDPASPHAGAAGTAAPLDARFLSTVGWVAIPVVAERSANLAEWRDQRSEIDLGST